MKVPLQKVTKAKMKIKNILDEIYKKRLEMLSKENVKILYSTMSFLYLYGYKNQDLDSFFTLHDILHFSKPNLVAIPLSEKEYQDTYTKVMGHPKFDETMQRLEYFAKIKSGELKDIQGIDEKNWFDLIGLRFDLLEKLYPIYFCKKNKCRIIYADKPEEEYKRMLDAKLRLQEMYKSNQKPEINLELVNVTPVQELNKSKEELEKEILVDRREEFFVDSIMQQMQPKFNVLPGSLYKTVVAVTDPSHLRGKHFFCGFKSVGIASLWKKKFKTTYNHEIVEDEDSQKK